MWLTLVITGVLVLVTGVFTWIARAERSGGTAGELMSLQESAARPPQTRPEARSRRRAGERRAVSVATPPAREPSAGAERIRGIVADGFGRPVAGIVVEARRRWEEPSSLRELLAGRKKIGSLNALLGSKAVCKALSDERGRFELERPAGAPDRVLLGTTGRDEGRRQRVRPGRLAKPVRWGVREVVLRVESGAVLEVEVVTRVGDSVGPFCVYIWQPGKPMGVPLGFSTSRGVCTCFPPFAGEARMLVVSRSPEFLPSEGIAFTLPEQGRILRRVELRRARALEVAVRRGGRALESCTLEVLDLSRLEGAIQPDGVASDYRRPFSRKGSGARSEWDPMISLIRFGRAETEKSVFPRLLSRGRTDRAGRARIHVDPEMSRWVLRLHPSPREPFVLRRYNYVPAGPLQVELSEAATTEGGPPKTDPTAGATGTLALRIEAAGEPELLQEALVTLRPNGGGKRKDASPKRLGKDRRVLFEGLLPGSYRVLVLPDHRRLAGGVAAWVPCRPLCLVDPGVRNERVVRCPLQRSRLELVGAKSGLPLSATLVELAGATGYSVMGVTGADGSLSLVPGPPGEVTVKVFGRVRGRGKALEMVRARQRLHHEQRMTGEPKMRVEVPER